MTDTLAQARELVVLEDLGAVAQGGQHVEDYINFACVHGPTIAQALIDAAELLTDIANGAVYHDASDKARDFLSKIGGGDGA